MWKVFMGSFFSGKNVCFISCKWNSTWNTNRLEKQRKIHNTTLRHKLYMNWITLELSNNKQVVERLHMFSGSASYTLFQRRLSFIFKYLKVFKNYVYLQVQYLYRSPNYFNCIPWKSQNKLQTFLFQERRIKEL